MKEKISQGRFQGTSGTGVTLSTNFFRCNLGVMNSNKDHIYQYRVDFYPITDNVPLKKEMIAYVLEHPDSNIRNHIFEG